MAKKTDNSLYEQLKVDIEKEKKLRRLYVPVAVFKNPEKMKVDVKVPVKKRPFVALLSTLIK